MLCFEENYPGRFETKPKGPTSSGSPILRRTMNVSARRAWHLCFCFYFADRQILKPGKGTFRPWLEISPKSVYQTWDDYCVTRRCPWYHRKQPKKNTMLTITTPDQPSLSMCRPNDPPAKQVDQSCPWQASYPHSASKSVGLAASRPQLSGQCLDH